MNLQTMLVTAASLMLLACAEKEAPAPEPAADAPMAAAGVIASTPGNEPWKNEAFLKHMHQHAEKLDDLNFALADGDLEAAMTPAYWLSKHETFDDVQQEWLPFLYGMRNEAEAVEAATDLETARAAAERITAHCQSCHAAAGIDVR